MTTNESSAPGTSGASPSNPSSNTISTTTPHGGKKSTRVIVIAIVVALVIVGITTWLVVRSQSDASPLPVETSTAVVPTEEPTVSTPTQADVEPIVTPFSLTDGVGDPSEVTALGVWSGIAVFNMVYPLPDAQDVIWDVHSVLRAVEVKTGKVLWTYDHLSDGSTFSVLSSAADDGNFAVTMRLTGSADDRSKQIVSGTQTLVMSLTTGEVWASRFLDRQVSTDAYGSITSAAESIITYHDGILALHRWIYGSTHDAPLTHGVSAYRQDDLDSPLWQSTGDHDSTVNAPIWWSQSDMSLPGGYILSASGDYVGISDGKKLDISAVDDHGQTPSIVFSRGDTVLVGVVDPNSDPAYSGAITSLSVWDQKSNSTLWTYALSDKAVVWPSDVCVRGDTLFITDTQFVDSANQGTTEHAFDLASGKEKWSIILPDPAPISTGDSTLVMNGGQPFVTLPDLPSDGSVPRTYMVDIATGTQVTSVPVDQVLPCQDGFVCTVTYGVGQPATVSLAKPASPGTPLWSAQATLIGQDAYNLAFPTESGTIFIAQDQGKYEFWTM